MQREGRSERRRLLLFFAPADHQHRDAACATLSWLAHDCGSLFECYYGGQASGEHFGGGHPDHVDIASRRGGTLVGGHHLEQLALVVQRFACEAVCFGAGPFDQFLCDADVPIIAASQEIDDLYAKVFAALKRPLPDTLVVIGDGGRPDGIDLGPYGFPEVVDRRAVAIADGDADAFAALATGRTVLTLWARPASGAMSIETPAEQSAAAQTTWMAERHAPARGFLIGDPELVGRWTPTAVREGWTPIFGIPQSNAMGRVESALREQDLAYGRQQEDGDFLTLSRLGVAFQLIDPGRPPFPVIKESPGTWPEPPQNRDEPSDAQLESWASEGALLSTLLFWTGMARELENLYALTDVLALSGMRAGLILTSESFGYMLDQPLSLVNVPRESGGLFPRVETLLASGGAGAFMESMTPPERFARSLDNAVAKLHSRLGGDAPRGWWPVLDCPLVPTRDPRFALNNHAPFVRLRYHPAAVSARGSGSHRRSAVARLRGRLRETPVRHFFEARRPFDAFRAGEPARDVFATVRRSGFEYALTKAAGGLQPSTVTGVDGLTIINHTAGTWGGWTPFVTVDSFDQLHRAERNLLRRGKPGWLLGTLDACLWTFTGPVWKRGAELRRMCDHIAGGGSNGRVVNVTPRTIARYARVLERRGLVTSIEAT